MKVVYRHYEPNQGLEEIQAKIYTELSGLPATAEQIRERNTRRDPRTTRYVLTEKGGPLAYITARDAGSHVGRTYMGYPWALPSCPIEAQERIFNDLLDYLMKRKETREIATTVVLASRNAQNHFNYFRRKGFALKENFFRYSKDFDATETSKWEMTDEVRSFASRLVTNEDVNQLIELCLADPFLGGFLPSEEAVRAHIEQRALKDGHAMLVLHEGQIVAAGALAKAQPDGFYLDGDEERIMMRFSVTRQGYPQAWRRLLIELAKECLAAGWADIPLRVTSFLFSGNGTAANLAQVTPGLDIIEVIMTLGNGD